MGWENKVLSWGNSKDVSESGPRLACVRTRLEWDPLAGEVVRGAAGD